MGKITVYGAKPAPKKPPAKRTAPGLVSVAKSSVEQERRWQAESDLRTMQTMAEIKRDPARLKAAEAVLNAQLAAIKAVK